MTNQEEQAMNKTLIAVALSLAIPTAFAAGLGAVGEYGPPRGPNLERMTQTLGLSDEQRTEMESVLQTQAEKRQALREETRTLIRAILDEEQSAKMDEMRQHRKERLADRRMERFAGHRPCHRPHR